MDREQIVDGLHALSQTFRYYGKELDDTQVAFWKSSMREMDLEHFKAALRHHINNSRYAPKISDIRGALEEIRESSVLSNRNQALHSPPTNEAPPHVARAWQYVTRQWGGDGSTLFGDPKLTEEEVDEALMLCNEQAARNLNPEAIPPHCWLDQVWGCSRDEAIERTPA